MAVVALVLGCQDIALAQDHDAQEVSSYKLTDAGLAKYKQAHERLSGLPATCTDIEGEDDSDAKTIDDMVAKMNALPGVQSAIQSTGLSTREYVVFSFSLMQSGMAAWATSQPGGKLPPGVAQANVDFFKQHEAELAALGEQPGCEEESGEEEES
jgi:hypothetical protein